MIGTIRTHSPSSGTGIGRAGYPLSPPAGPFAAAGFGLSPPKLMAEKMRIDVPSRDANFALIASGDSFQTYAASPPAGRGTGPILRIVQKDQCAPIHLVSHQSLQVS